MCLAHWGCLHFSEVAQQRHFHEKGILQGEISKGGHHYIWRYVTFEMPADTQVQMPKRYLSWGIMFVTHGPWEWRKKSNWFCQIMVPVWKRKLSVLFWFWQKIRTLKMKCIVVCGKCLFDILFVRLYLFYEVNPVFIYVVVHLVIKALWVAFKGG